MLTLCPEGVGRPFALEVHEGSDLISERLRQERVWEPYETALVVGTLAPGATFVDVGANIGYYTLLASRLVGSRGAVVAFEPDPHNFTLLERNCAAHDERNIRLYRLGLGRERAEATLYLSPDNLGDHRLFDEGARATATVLLAPGDEVLGGQLARMDFLKIDTQGGECGVVAGLAGLIREHRRHLHMIVEFWPYGLSGAGGSPRELVETLAGCGLRFSVIDHIGRRLEPTKPGILIERAERGDLRPATGGFINLYLEPAIS